MPGYAWPPIVMMKHHLFVRFTRINMMVFFASSGRIKSNKSELVVTEIFWLLRKV